jgi:hypothetical protein
MNAVDTKVLARFFVTDPDDVESAKQHPAAIRAMSEKVFVSASVVLEFEWVPKPNLYSPSSVSSRWTYKHKSATSRSSCVDRSSPVRSEIYDNL